MVANEVEGRAEGLRRIAACRAAQAEELDLGGLQLTALEGELLAALCQLVWLRRLVPRTARRGAEKSRNSRSLTKEKTRRWATRSARCPALYSMR